jgi:hypothetical protein
MSVQANETLLWAKKRQLIGVPLCSTGCFDDKTNKQNSGRCFGLLSVIRQEQENRLLYYDIIIKVCKQFLRLLTVIPAAFSKENSSWGATGLGARDHFTYCTAAKPRSLEGTLVSAFLKKCSLPLIRF